LLTYFVEQLTDPEEKARAWKRYHIIRDFVESRLCRHRQICSHFGEKPKFEKCDACDACGSELDWLAPPVVAKPPASGIPAISARSSPPSSHSGSSAKATGSAVDSELREYLREWRRATAKEPGVPAFVVMHDTSLDELCRRRPRNISQLLDVPGFGERKSEMYGQKIFDALARFGSGSRATPEIGRKTRPARHKKLQKSAGR
jgi:ATP-dependent DNA helicase RecQ